MRLTEVLGILLLGQLAAGQGSGGFRLGSGGGSAPGSSGSSQGTRQSSLFSPPTTPAASLCPTQYPYAYYNGSYCCTANRETIYPPQGGLCDGSLIGRDSLCCAGQFTPCPAGEGNCTSAPAPVPVCPAQFPFVYYNGSYCCSLNRETIFSPQGALCDGSPLQWDSLCCGGDFVSCPSGGSNCISASASTCPLSHPYPFATGTACCQYNQEGVNSTLGAACDGSSLNQRSQCCKDNKFIACNATRCTSAPVIECPSTYPFAYMYGSYCCKTNQEKVNTEQGSQCDGGALKFNSLCCAGDEFISCPGNNCTSVQGCDFDPNSALFALTYNSSRQSGTNWNFTLTDPISTVANTVGWPNYNWMPDGKLSTLSTSSGTFYTFYPNMASYRTTGPSTLPQESTRLDPGQAILGGLLYEDVYNNGGQWLMAVHATNLSSGQLIGFIHAEDHYWSGTAFSTFAAHKSVALACSADNGATWQTRGQILTVGSKPPNPTTCCTGAGDQDVVWDWQNKRWYMATMDSAAVSYDKSARLSSWRKWNGTDFGGAPLGDSMVPLRDSKGQRLPSGSNPAIHWNTYLQLWVMIWAGWDGNIYITSARTLPNFAPARIVIRANNPPVEKNWYPTLLSQQFGDRVGDSLLYLYFRWFPQGTGSPSMFRTTKIRFCRGTDCTQ